ncbi:MAG: hypothetical protein AB8B80_17310 [Marinicellaceae bacterium]
MNKKNQNGVREEGNELVKVLPQEIIELLADEYNREQTLKRNILRLKIWMSKTYVSKLVH